MPPTPTNEQRNAIKHIGESLPLTAGAGSGKTFVLTHRYFQILAEQDANLDEILTITFTEKAATQMKLKIRELLHTFAQGELPQDFPPVQKSTFQVPEQSVWQELLDHFQQSYIGTFHGFCARFLREVAMEVGIDPEFAVMDEQTTALRRPEIIRRSIFQLIEAEDESIATWLQYYSVFQILETFGGMVLNRSRYEELSDFYLGTDESNPKSVEILLSELKSRYAKISEPVLENLRHHPDWLELSSMLQNIIAKDPSDSLYDHYTILLQSLSVIEAETSVIEEINAWITIAENLKSKGKKGNWDGVDFGEFKSLMKSFRDETLKPALEGLAVFDETTERTAIELAQAGVQIYQTVLKQYQDWKRQHNFFDYDDLLIETVKILKKHSEIRRRYNKQFQHILVDEFQDTNPIQYELVNLLRLDENENEVAKLFVVGDPKQSIYRFRGTEVRLFNEAQRALPGKDQPLQLSFRSQPALLEWFDVCFTRIMGTPDTTVPLENFEQHYLPLTPHRKNFQPEVPHITTQIIKAKSRSESDSVANRIQVEAAHIAKWLQTRLPKIEVEGETRNSRSAKFGDVAMLFRRTRYMKQYEYALQMAGIPYYTVGGKGFYSKQEIQDLLTILRALTHPEDDISLAGVLRSALFGLSDEGLFWLSRGRVPWQQILYNNQYEIPEVLEESDKMALEIAREKMQSWKQLKDRIPIGRLVEMICTETGYFGVLGAGNDGVQKVRNVEQFIGVARQFEQSMGASVHGFVRYILSIQDEAETEEAEVYSGEHNAVQLLTIHKSKGLEFPVVILPNIDGGGQHRIQKDFYPNIGWALDWNDPEKSADEQKTKSIAYHQINALERKQNLAESKRLFYVASTRAKDHLFLSGIVQGEDGVEKALSKDADSKDDWLVWVLDVLQSCGWEPGQENLSLKDSTLQVLEFDYSDVDSLPGVSDILGVTKNATEQPQNFSKTELLSLQEIQQRWKVNRSAIVLDEITPSMISDFAESPEKFRDTYLLGIPDLQQRYRSTGGLAGAQFGTVAHAVVERWIEEQPDNPERLINDYIEHSIFRGNTEAQSLLESMLSELKESELYRNIDSTTVSTEVPFLTSISGKVMTGNIDLLLENTSGGYSIIDLKSDTMKQQNSLEKKKQKYKFQLLAYASALYQSRKRLPDLLALYFLRTGDLAPISCDVESFGELEALVDELIQYAEKRY